MDKVRVGVIGVGAMGLAHVAAYRANARCELTALCDRDGDWVQRAKQECGARRAFTDWEELAACEDVDAVSVCLPTVFHAPATLAALRTGKHVLCEKPMAANAQEARAMAEAAAAAGKLLMVGYNQRLGGDIRCLKRHIEAGHLGEVYLIHTAWRRPMGVLPPPTHTRPTGETYSRNWFNEKAMAGGVGTDLGSHIADLAMYLLGFPKVRQVVGRAYTKFGPAAAGEGLTADADDHTVGFVKLENGASMIVEASFGCFVERETIVQAVYGDRGGALREAGQPVKVFSREGDTNVTRTLGIDLPTVSPMDHFIDCLTEGTRPLITPEEGVAVTELLDGLYASSEEKGAT
jgi:predicted dehydrogenase